MRRAVSCRSRASRPRRESWFEYIPLLRGARTRRGLIDSACLNFFGGRGDGVARFSVSATVLVLVGRPPGGDVGPRRDGFPTTELNGCSAARWALEESCAAYSAQRAHGWLITGLDC